MLSSGRLASPSALFWKKAGVEAYASPKSGREARASSGISARATCYARACVEIKFQAPHAIDTILSPQLHLLDGVEVHEGLRNNSHFSG